MIFAVAFIFCTLFFRLFYLQVNSGQNLQLRAVEQWVRTLPLKAKRGDIIDCSGKILAYSETSYDVYVRAKEVDNAVETTKTLCSILDLNFERTYDKVKNVFSSENIIKLQIDSETALKLLNKNLNGIYITENIQRIYPYGTSLSQVIGFLTNDSVGQTGIENYFNKILAGTDGKYLTQSDVRGISLDSSLRYYIEGIDGLNIKTTIDIDIQNIVMEVLDKIMIEHNPKKVSAIILNPTTSEIISLAILPTFDLNNIQRDNVTELMELVKNYLITDVYEPGSTFKILTLAAALSEGLTSLNETFYCPGYRIIDGEKVKCWRTIGHGTQTLVECVQNSCNCCFMDLAQRLGKEKLYKYLKAFGIGSKTGVDISGESSGLLIDENLVQNCDLVRIGFGQSVAVTPLQLINAFCAVINGGTLYQPTLIENYYNNENEITYQNFNMICSNCLLSEVSSTIRYLLEQSLSKNGEKTFIDGYIIAGKTGTAQKYGEDGKISSGKYISSFFGFLNENDRPQYALLLCVDEPSSGAYYGSVVAKPYAKEIFEQIISLKNISSSEDSIESSLQSICVPNLVGKSLSQAIIILQKNGLSFEISGEGESITSQYPLANSYVLKNSEIQINTN